MTAATAETNGRTAAPPLAANPFTREIPLSQIDESPKNPRKTFADVDDLAKDVAIHGVLQPVLVRPVGKRYELVFGARRFRAAKLAKLATVPAMVRELDDAIALELAIVENAKRSDIHPLEEADAYETLHKTHGYSVEEIAAKVGKSAATIRMRMKLCTLVPEGRKAFAEGKLTAGAALVLARVPHADLQKSAVREVLARRRDDDDPVSLVDASWVVRSRYMLRLAEAPFDRADAALVAGATACGDCPKRTGNQRELFAEVSAKDDLCTDPKCFDAKKAAAWKKKVADAQAAGTKVLSDKEAKKVFPYSGSTLAHDAKFIDLDAKRYEDGKQRTSRQLLGKKVEVPVVLARDPDGGIHELVAVDDFRKAAKTAGVKARAKSSGSSYSAEEKKRREAAKKKADAVRAIVDKLVARAGNVRSARFELAFARIIAAGVVQLVWHDTAKAICARDKLEIPKNGSPRDVLAKAAASLDVHECRGLVVEVLASDDMTRKALCALFKVKA
jgi:ParB/RepB/Spo0J family partition protein